MSTQPMKFDFISYTDEKMTGYYCTCDHVLMGDMVVEGSKEVHRECGKPILREMDFMCAQEEYDKKGHCNG